MAANASEPDGPKGSAKNVQDYNSFCEGDVEPHLCKKVHSLIYKQKEFIVFLDEELYVEWAYAEDGKDGSQVDKYLRSKEAGIALNRVQELQALPTSNLTEKEKQSYQMLIGEAVARVLQQSIPASEHALDKAHQLLLARNAEKSRWWYLSASIATAVIALVALGDVWLYRDYVRVALTEPLFKMLMASAAGAAGALLSVLLGARVAPSEAASSRHIHYFLGAAKILAGMLGAVLVGLGLRSEMLAAPLVRAATNPELLFLFFCMIAGASERFVPNFIERVEATSLSSKKKA